MSERTPAETPDLADRLIAYLDAREAQRADDVERTLAAMTERERRLVREAAVMGYVNGSYFGRHRDHIPADSAILAEVISYCRSHPDLYPVLSKLAP